MDCNQDVYVCTWKNGHGSQTVYVSAVWHAHVYRAFKQIADLPEDAQMVHSRKASPSDLEHITALLKGETAETRAVEMIENSRFRETLTYIFPNGLKKAL